MILSRLALIDQAASLDCRFCDLVPGAVGPRRTTLQTGRGAGDSVADTDRYGSRMERVTDHGYRGFPAVGGVGLTGGLMGADDSPGATAKEQFWRQFAPPWGTMRPPPRMRF